MGKLVSCEPPALVKRATVLFGPGSSATESSFRSWGPEIAAGRCLGDTTKQEQQSETQAGEGTPPS